jgi:hypothetical protein
MLSESAREATIATAYLPIGEDWAEGVGGFKDIDSEPLERAASRNFLKKWVRMSVEMATP